MRRLFHFLLTTGLVLFLLGNSNSINARTIRKDTNDIYNLQDETYKLSFRLQTGYLTGTANELVYAGSYSDELLSKLIWEIDELYMTGFGASIQKEWVAIHADAWFKATDGEGTMDDYDWIFGGPGWSDWSHHDDTIVSESYFVDLNCEFMIPKLSTNSFVTSAILGFKHEHYEWQARGGSYIYSSNPGWRDNIGTFTPGQLGITYSQTYDTPYIGIGMRGSLGRFEFNGRLIGTIFAYVEAKDTHHLRNMNTVAKMDKGEMYSVDITGGYHFTDHWVLEVSYAYTKYNTVRDDSTYHYANGSTITWIELEGADLETNMVSIVLSYSF